MKSNKKRFKNPNSGFFTPMIPVMIVCVIIGIAGLVYGIAQFF